MVAPATSRPNDVNFQRYIYVLACLVGQTVTVELRNNLSFSGIFHSYNVPGPAGSSDNVLILKYARELPRESRLSGPIEDTVVIHSDDVVSISAFRCPLTFNDTAPKSRSGFKTDAEISQNQGGASDRELERWEPSGGDGASASVGLLESKRPLGSMPWDQFEVNKRQFNVNSTYQEDFYTTPLDVGSIPQFVKEKADQIAREIEAANTHGADEAEDEDEEGRFGAVRGTGAYRNGSVAGSVTTTAVATSQPAAAGYGPQPADRKGERLAAGGDAVPPAPAAPPAWGASKPQNDQETALLQRRDSTALRSAKVVGPARQKPASTTEALPSDPTSKASYYLTRSTADLPHRVVSSSRGSKQPANVATMRATNQTLVKNINALNLEPALSKLDERLGRGHFQGKLGIVAMRGSSNSRSVTDQVEQRAQEKKQFLLSLDVIRDRMSRIDWSCAVPPRTSIPAAAAALYSRRALGAGPSGGGARLLEEHPHPSSRHHHHHHPAVRRQALEESNGVSSRSVGSVRASIKNFTFNPNADAFTPQMKDGNSASRKDCPECNADETVTGPCPHVSSRSNGGADDGLGHASSSTTRPGSRGASGAVPSSMQFKAFKVNPRYSQHIDQLLATTVLEHIVVEDPSSVSPRWNADLDSAVPRQPCYSDILGLPPPGRSGGATGKGSRGVGTGAWGGSATTPAAAAKGSFQEDERPASSTAEAPSVASTAGRAFRNTSGGGANGRPAGTNHPRGSGSQAAGQQRTTGERHNSVAAANTASTPPPAPPATTASATAPLGAAPNAVALNECPVQQRYEHPHLVSGVPQVSYATMVPASTAMYPAGAAAGPQQTAVQLHTAPGGYPAAFTHFNGNYYVLPRNALLPQTAIVGTFMTEEGMPTTGPAGGNVSGQYQSAPPHQVVAPTASGPVELHSMVPVDPSALLLQHHQQPQHGTAGAAPGQHPSSSAALHAPQQNHPQQQPVHHLHQHAHHGGQQQQQPTAHGVHAAGASHYQPAHHLAHHAPAHPGGYSASPSAGAYPAPHFMGLQPAPTNVMFFPSGAFLTAQPSGATTPQQPGAAQYVHGNHVAATAPAGTIAAAPVQWMVASVPPQLPQKPARNGTAALGGTPAAAGATQPPMPVPLEAQGLPGAARQPQGSAEALQPRHPATAPHKNGNNNGTATAPHHQAAPHQQTADCVYTAYPGGGAPYGSRHHMHKTLVGGAPAMSSSGPQSSSQESHPLPPPPPPPPPLQQHTTALQSQTSSGSYSNRSSSQFHKQSLSGQHQMPPPPPGAADGLPYEYRHSASRGSFGGPNAPLSKQPLQVATMDAVGNLKTQQPHCDAAATPAASATHTADSPTSIRGAKGSRKPQDGGKPALPPSVEKTTTSSSSS